MSYKYGNQHASKVVLQLTLDGIPIKRWYSVGAAAKEVKRSVSSISSCARGHTKQCGGFKWRYDDVPK